MSCPKAAAAKMSKPGGTPIIHQKPPSRTLACVTGGLPLGSGRPSNGASTARRASATSGWPNRTSRRPHGQPAFGPVVIEERDPRLHGLHRERRERFPYGLAQPTTKHPISLDPLNVDHRGRPSRGTRSHG